ncbi:MAG: hypothetical protein LBP80_02740 [Treponema sp.]|nr:hypothetical protein [Treponema sp.]
MAKAVCFIAVLLGILVPAKSFAADYIDGRIKLTLNESTGRFSLYYLTDRAVNRFESFFSDQDPRTSSLSIMINERVYKLGEAPSFTARIGGAQANPALVFESPGMIVTEEFTFISVNGQSETTGVRVNIRIENRGNRASNVGARFIIDTKLGESANTSVDHFTTSDRGIRSETLFDRKWPDKWWISRGGSFGLMGSISTAYSTAADYVHFANWKRLNDATWELQYNRRNFTNPPYSINDSAVSYVFNPQRLPAGESRTYSILLAAADENGFAQVTFKPDSADTRAAAVPDRPASNPPSSGTAPPQERTGPSSRQPSEEETMRSDLAILKDLLGRLDDCLEGRVTLSEEELTNIELILNRIKDRYEGR